MRTCSRLIFGRWAEERVAARAPVEAQHRFDDSLPDKGGHLVQDIPVGDQDTAAPGEFVVAREENAVLVRREVKEPGVLSRSVEPEIAGE